MKKFILIFICFCFIVQIKAQAQVVINEFQAAPVKDEPEWIELYNYGTTQYLLSAPSISDAVTTKKLSPFTLSPKQYAVITKDTTMLLAKRKIPNGTLIIQEAIPILNNSSDEIVLKDNSITIDSIYYDMIWGEYGISMERRDYLIPAVSYENLTQSISKDSATCGYVNSVAVRDYDLSIDSLKLDVLTNTINIKISNVGRRSLSQTHFTLMVDINKDGIYQNDESFFEDEIPLIGQKSSLIINVSLNSIQNLNKRHGYFQFKAFIYNNSDEINSNDSLIQEIFISYPFGSILINEFLLDNSECKCEFIEFFNTLNEQVSLNKWYIRDASEPMKKKPFQILSDSISIMPVSYFVIFLDSTCTSYFNEINYQNTFITKAPFNLNTTGDEIALIDPNGLYQDTLTYLVDWLNYPQGSVGCHSIEKINPELLSSNKNNWKVSVDLNGTTPGNENSTYISLDSTGKISAKPNPFSPYSTNKDQTCNITYNLQLSNTMIKAKIYDLNGIEVRTIADSEILPPKGLLTWDGKNNNGFIVQIGAYVLLFEAEDIVRHSYYKQKILLVVGK